jgi:sugar lactone lactonase YvrE
VWLIRLLRRESMNPGFVLPFWPTKPVDSGDKHTDWHLFFTSYCPYLFRSVLICFLLLCGAQPLWATGEVTFNGGGSYSAGVVRPDSYTLSSPSGIALDASGNIYITDSNNHRDLKVTARGHASVLPTGSFAPSNVSRRTVDRAGNVYIVDAAQQRIVKLTGRGVTSVLNLADVRLCEPTAVTVDGAGNIYIADAGDGRNNGQIVKVMSSGAASVLNLANLSNLGGGMIVPSGVAVDAEENVYFTNSPRPGYAGLMKVPALGVPSVLAGWSGGANGDDTFTYPFGLAVDAAGNVYVADGAKGIVKVTPAGATSVLNTGSLKLNPMGLALDAADNIYVADTGNDRLVKLTIMPAVNFGEIALGAPAVTQSLSFNIPAGVTLGTVPFAVLTVGTTGADFQSVNSGTTCVAGTTNAACVVKVNFLPLAPGLRRGAVVLYDSSNNPVTTVPIYGLGDAPMVAFSPGTASVISTGSVSLHFPSRIALDGAGNMYVGNLVGANVVKIGPGGSSASLVSTPGLTLGQVSGVALDGAGNLYIADYTNSQIIEVTVAGGASVLSLSGLTTPLVSPTDLTIDGAGNLYIADYGNARVVMVTPTGTASVVNTGTYTIPPSGLASVAVDATGTVYIADQINNQVITVPTAGVPAILVPASFGQLNGPRGVAVDGMGNVYIADTGNNRIVTVTKAGIISELQVLNLPAPSSLNSVGGIAVDGNGLLYITDSGNNRLVKVDVTAASLSFGQTLVGAPSIDSPKTVIVTNLGNQPLVFSTNPSTSLADFGFNTGDANPCAASTQVAAGSTCHISINFTAQQLGTRSDSVTLKDNALNSLTIQQHVALSGTGVPPADTTAVALSVNPTAVPANQTITITATVTDRTSGHASTVPTGAVTFIDTLGTTAVSLNGGNPVTLDTSGNATLLGVTLTGLGSHTITAYYSGVSGSFLPNDNATPVIVTKSTQTITFPNPGTQIYGGTVTLAATAGSGLPVTYKVNSGPATLNGSSKLTMTGTGSVTVTASQTGSSQWAAASDVSVTFSVSSAPLTITALDQTKTYDGTAFPTASYAVNYNGFVNGDTFAALSGTLSYGGNAVGATNAGSYAITPGGLTSSNYAITFTSGTLTINKVTLTATGNNATMTYGTSLPSLTGTLAGMVAGDIMTASWTTTATATSAAGTYPITPVLNDPGNKQGNYTLTSTNGTLTINKAGAVAAVQTSAIAVLLKSALTFTARVTSATSGTPTGSVNFMDGSTSLGSATLDNTGYATLTLSTLSAGSHSITTVYAGDTNFTTNTSSVLTQTVQDFQFSINGTSATDTTQAVLSATVLSGQIATYQFQLTPTNGTTFPSVVTLTLTGLPTGATYTITPLTLAAGSGAQSVTVQVYTARSTADLRPRGQKLPIFALGLLLPMMGLVQLCRSTQSRTKRAALLLLLLLAIGILGMAGCGGGSGGGGGGHASQTYTLQLNATSGSLQHFTMLGLTIQ